MTPDERIAELENDLAKLRSDLAEVLGFIQYVGGESRAFQSAVLALIASHPQPHALAPDLKHHLLRTEASIVHGAQDERHVQGMQAAQTVLLAALDEALARSSTS